MKYVILAIELADGSQDISAYVVDCDVDARGGVGSVQLSKNIADARRFDSPIDALGYWKRRSRVNPTRLDGRPNRPLTAYTVVIERIDE